jgi:spore maturation protein CgeB
MNFVFFTHSLVSCWNHGNAHFLRGVLRALTAAGHRTVAYEPRDGWSRENLVRDHGRTALAGFVAAFPELAARQYGGVGDIEAAVADADVVVVHEWTEPEIIAALGRLRRSGARFRLLFHDTHHRAVSDPEAARAWPIEDYDAVLAFGESLAEVYRRWGWGDRVLVWHEAADTSIFRPLDLNDDRQGVVWIGNWGDEERTEELEIFLFRPVDEEGMPLSVYGVRYPEAARRRLAGIGAHYGGWLANYRVPEVFAHHLCTVHVPRRFYAEQLPGIPTIRLFEAMACGIPLICAPWQDTEGLFREGRDYLLARDGEAVRRHLRLLRNDTDAWHALRRSGLDRIAKRHSCHHRAEELLEFLAALDRPTLARETA